MKFKFLGASLCLVLISSSLLASTQVFDLNWSGNTSYIQSLPDYTGAVTPSASVLGEK